MHFPSAYANNIKQGLVNTIIYDIRNDLKIKTVGWI
jgi:hypothetical protein